MVNPIICTWEAQLPQGNGLVWPDGCRDLIAIIPREQRPKVICSGLDGSARQIICETETRFVGVRLAPGVTFPWDTGDPRKMRLDVELSYYLPSFGQCWSFRTDRELVLNELIRQIDSMACPAPNWVANYFDELRTGMVVNIQSLSERSMRRKLVQATGAPPRYWQGLVRARKVGLEVSRSDTSLASIAADHGFSDQAHMSREIRRWFGCTPMTLRANRDQAMAQLAAPDVLRGS